MNAVLENMGGIAHFEAEITDLMVFIGRDGTSNRKLCYGLFDLIIKDGLGDSCTTHVFDCPEQKLFPTAQNELVSHYAERLNSGPNVHMFIVTHSPYILTALNNLIYAYQVGQSRPDEVSALVPMNRWINPQRVSAYFVKDGVATSIMDDGLQHIKAEEIDEASTLTNVLYDELLDIKIDGEIEAEMQGISVGEIDRASDLTLELHTNLLEIELKGT